MGAVQFMLKPNNDRHGLVAKATRLASVAREAVLQSAGAEGVVPPPPWLPYVINLVMYTQMCISNNSDTSTTELLNEYEAYLDPFTGKPVEYPAIVTSLLATANGMVFLMLPTSNQV